ncbi:hypothetical protein [Bacillus mojavensis]|uniref:hypothetical protein n=1 Tax=Bacillus mojavensis TaxID=72360 RepID=UPI001454E66A|nr:hypothetical protein [Bacillus mojavensis]
MSRFILYTLIAVLLSIIINVSISLVNPEAGDALSFPISCVLGLIAGWKAAEDE